MHAAVHAAGQRKRTPEGCGDRTASIHARVLEAVGACSRRFRRWAGPAAVKTCGVEMRICMYGLPAKRQSKNPADAATSARSPDVRSSVNTSATADPGGTQGVRGNFRCCCAQATASSAVARLAGNEGASSDYLESSGVGHPEDRPPTLRARNSRCDSVWRSCMHSPGENRLQRSAADGVLLDWVTNICSTCPDGLRCAQRP